MGARRATTDASMNQAPSGAYQSSDATSMPRNLPCAWIQSPGPTPISLLKPGDADGQHDAHERMAGQRQDVHAQRHDDHAQR